MPTEVKKYRKEPKNRLKTAHFAFVLHIANFVVYSMIFNCRTIITITIAAKSEVMFTFYLQYTGSLICQTHSAYRIQIVLIIHRVQLAFDHSIITHVRAIVSRSFHPKKNRKNCIPHQIHCVKMVRKILFIHPDLGIGGAERLVVDAALALQNRGHSVQFLTNHHDPAHCFEETRNGQLKVETVGDWLPRTTFNRLIAFWAYIRMLYACIYAAFFLTRHEKFDMIFIDSISFGIPALKYAYNTPKILFYCHFPDFLMAPPTETMIRRMYRAPINLAEEYTTGEADFILVNSLFTQSVFKKTFKSIKTVPSALYPSLNTKYFDETDVSSFDASSFNIPEDADIVYLSINRYERKKNLPMALKAFKELGKHLPKAIFDRCHLIMAGGYDVRVTENVEHFTELTSLAEELDITEKLSMLRSPSDAGKLWLLKRCTALLYTPSNEHFGIVPIEAMYMERPVIACNSGGPTETVVNGETGFLCEPSAVDFGRRMASFALETDLAGKLGKSGRERVKQHFSFQAFTNKLDTLVKKATDDWDYSM